MRASGALSGDLIEGGAAGAVAHLSPLTAALAHFDEQVAETSSALGRDANVLLRTRLEKRLEKLKACRARKQEELDGALRRLQVTTLASSRALSLACGKRRCWKNALCGT